MIEAVDTIFARDYDPQTDAVSNRRVFTKRRNWAAVSAAAPSRGTCCASLHPRSCSDAKSEPLMLRGFDLSGPDKHGEDFRQWRENTD